MCIFAKRLTVEKMIEKLARGNIGNIDTDINYYKASNTLTTLVHNPLKNNQLYMFHTNKHSKLSFFFSLRVNNFYRFIVWSIKAQYFALDNLSIT